MNAVKRVYVRNVEHHARRAIAQRIGCTSSAIISVARDESHPESVILHVNSGGNARAAELELRWRGYSVEPMDYNPFTPGHYGVKLRICPKRVRGRNESHHAHGSATLGIAGGQFAR